jgi:hypothetical protein
MDHPGYCFRNSVPEAGLFARKTLSFSLLRGDIDLSNLGVQPRRLAFKRLGKLAHQLIELRKQIQLLCGAQMLDFFH